MRERLATVTRIAERAGQLLLRHYRSVTAERKGDQSLVTVADREAERLIREELGRAFPGQPLLGEEYGRTGPADDQAWFIDPLDGTTNFVHQIPFWCVAIGWLEEGRAALGVIHNPLLGETWAGAEGVGAWRNGEPLVPWPGRERFSPTDPVVVPTELLGRRLEFGAAVRVRSLGSAQLHFALVAGGSVRAGLWYRDYGWDLIAGIAIGRAAGVIVSTCDGQEPDLSALLDGRPQPWTLCAAPAGTHALLLEVLAAGEVPR